MIIDHDFVKIYKCEQNMNDFIGRKTELKRLQEISKIGPNLIVIRGRRRIGKSRLVQEYGKDKRFLEFSGLAPVGNIDAQVQRNYFATQLIHQLKITPCTFKDWYDAFMFLSNHLTNDPTVIFFDEVSWMSEGDSTFIPKLKVWWDTVLQKYPNVQLVLCGSVSTWIEENIVNSTALFGRISLQLTLEELSLHESYEFLKKRGFKGSNYDILKILSVIGSVPWYLKQINPELLADDNIKHLCFMEGGILTNEFERIFSDLYKGETETYKKIIYALADGMKTLAELRNQLGYEHGGFLGRYVRNLCIAGFIIQHNTWSFKTNKILKRSVYSLSDNFIRFYIKYVEPNLSKIKNNAYTNLSLEHLPGWQGIMGFQLESLLLKNRQMIIKSIVIRPEEIIADNPYIQTATKKHRGCQIDYLIQTVTNNLFVCEFKFNRRELDSDIIDELKEKIDRLNVPKNYSKIPVLIHFGGISNAADEKQYFFRTIDINHLMEDLI